MLNRKKYLYGYDLDFVLFRFYNKNVYILSIYNLWIKYIYVLNIGQLIYNGKIFNMEIWFSQKIFLEFDFGSFGLRLIVFFLYLYVV